MEYEIFEEFYKNSYMLIRRMSAYYGLTQEELKQECAIVFFENPSIIENYKNGYERIAYRDFNRGLANSLVDFGNTGKQVVRNTDFEREKTSLERIHSNTDEEVNEEKGIMDKIELERLKEVYGDDYIDDILEYYDIGDERYSKKHGLKGATARTRIYRKVKRIRDIEG